MADATPIAVNNKKKGCQVKQGFTQTAYYVHKHDVALQYGGPEEGGWHYVSGVPTGFVLGPLSDEEDAYCQARALNGLEHERAERDEDYHFSSVLAYKSVHYSFSVEDFATPIPYPQERPHYE